MYVEIVNRLGSCRDTCNYANILADVEEYKALSGTCMARVIVKCVHSDVCRHVKCDEAETETL